MFVGSMILAYAMEHVQLHRRLGLLVLRYVGSSVMWYVFLLIFFVSNQSLNRSMAGLMAVTAFLSMWINNSAAANIMIPTAIAIVNELQNYEQTKKPTVDIDEKDSPHNISDVPLTNVSSKKHLYLSN